MTHDAQTLLTLAAQFAVISLLAFGGGQSVLPLMERVSVRQYGWLSAPAFTSGVGFGYMVPGPVTTTATFIGYCAAGFPGAAAATLGMFVPPVLLAALAAAGIGRLAGNRFVRAFSAGATPAVIGLLAATAWHIAQNAVTSPPLAVVALGATVLAARTKVSPIVILLGGAGAAVAAWACGLLAVAPRT